MSPLVKFVSLLKIKINEGNFFYILGRTVCLDSAMSKALRDNVLSLVADCDHRQTLIQDLIITNNKLK